MQVGDLLHDRETEPATAPARIRRTVEAIEHALALLRRNADAGVLDLQERTAVELAGGQGDLLHIFGSFNAPVLQLGDGTIVHIPGDPVSSFPAWCAAL